MAELPWTRPGSDWRAKLERARAHIEELERICADYRDGTPYRVTPHPTSEPGTTAYRLTVTEPIPGQLPLVVGDVLHNCRSALDALLYSAVSHDVGRPMSEAEERACQFPVEVSPELFRRFIDNHGVRRALFSPAIQQGLHWAQSFYWTEQGKDVLPELDVSYEVEAQAHPLQQLARLSNLDKHRRLTTTGFFPGLVYWTNHADGPDFTWQRGDDTYADGSVLMYITGPPAQYANLDYNLVIQIREAEHPDSTWPSDDTDLPQLAQSWIDAVNQAARSFTDGIARWRAVAGTVPP